MNTDKRTPEIGKEYLLFDDSDKFENSFYGIYLGKNPVKTPWYLNSKKLEGHIFVKLEDKKLEIYNIRVPESKLQFWYSCDAADEGACTPQGFAVDKFPLEKISKLEKEYFFETLNRLDKNKSN